MRTKQPFTRRQFIKTAGTVVVTAPIILQSTGLNAKSIAASDRINLGIIGCGGLGKANLFACASQPNVVVTAACDVWKERLDPVVEKYKSTCTGYTDFREMFLHKNLDAVIIATPAHWHAIMAIAAAEAGKDIYLQKPMTMHLGESLAVRNAVKKTTNIPKGMDWDMWVGPARMQPFNPNLVKDAFYHCFWMDFSGGWTLGMAPHIIDLPIWALNLGFPTEVSSTGGRFIIKDDSDAYDNHEIIIRFPAWTGEQTQVGNIFPWCKRYITGRL